MKTKPHPLFVLYQWLVALPVLIILTILTAVFTIILSPVFPNAQFSYFPARWWGRFFCYLLFIKVKITGLEKLDPKKSYVIAANHQSIYDIFVVYGWLPMIFKWVMKAELRKIPLVGKACESAGHIFIDRKNPVAAKKSLDKAEAQLRNGVSVVVFPEGTRTYTGQMGKFKKGAFRMATDLHLPIVPVTLRGCFERLPRNGFIITPGTIEMIVHEPVEVEGYEHEKQPELMQKLHDIIESAL
ncbi:MAG: lysophospholipid acyltransferase family protein [Paludibacter sp.]|nr:lysophospholipid acyltransferase family protein [Paludibacter sp.]MDD3490225.1 lysophospholipid acyltransferase family protein [Paludibacter sp.]